MTPLISVLIPAYNHEKFIVECVESVLAQDWPRMELLIVDDGSQDGTWAKVQDLSARARQSGRFERVEVATQENQGTCVTLNRLCGMSRGDIVAMIASDDKYLPGAFSAMMKPMLEDEQVGLVVGQNGFMDGEGQNCFWDKDQNVVYGEAEAVYRTFNEQLRALSGIPDDSPAFGRYEELVRMNHIANGYIIRRTFLERVLPFRKEAPLEDHWLHLQLSKICQYRAIPEMTFRYRWHAANSIKQRERMLAIADLTFCWEEHLVETLTDRQWYERYWRSRSREEIDFRVPGFLALGSIRTRTEKKRFCTLLGRRWEFRCRNLIKGFPRRCLAVVHVYYRHLWPELRDCLKNIDCLYDLVVTFGDETAVTEARRDRPDARFVRCENRGFDIWPFIKVMQETNLADYDIVVKLHTKRDCDVEATITGIRMRGPQWRRCLLSFVSTRENWQKSIRTLARPSVGMVAQHQLICGRRACNAKNLVKTFDRADRELARVNGVPRCRGGSFVAGSMFAARAAALRRLHVERITCDLFPQTASHDQETYAHVWERMLGLCVKYDHLRIEPFDCGYYHMLAENAINRAFAVFVRFFFQKKITASGHLFIKVCKIPVWRSQVSSNCSCAARDKV